MFEELLTLGREQGNGLFVGLACLNLGLVALGEGDPGRAGALFARPQERIQRAGNCRVGDGTSTESCG